MQHVERAYAKINLMLDVTGRRADGYHELLTVMQRISLYDTLFVERGGDGVELCTAAPLPTDGRNLVVRAANAYFAASGKPFGVRVTLEKRIPMQAGLGGGSSDAAAALRALNALDGMRFSEEELCRIAATVGADVPFCVVGGTQLCRGIGERMTRVENRLSAFLLVAMQGEGISTPHAFALLDERYGDFLAMAEAAERGAGEAIAALEKGDALALAPCLYNRFEEVTAQPFVPRLKQAMLTGGALCACMSGSGPAVFGLFERREGAEAVAATLTETGALAFVCEMK